MLTYVLRIVGLEITIMRLLKVNQNRYHFTQAQARGRPSLRATPNNLAFSHVANH